MTAGLANRSVVVHSTIVAWSNSRFTGTAEGELHFIKGYRLRLREEIDFDNGLITSYGYEVDRYDDRLYWYDDFPHPDDQTLRSTYPHHKHVPPEIRHHRVPALELSFNRPNLPFLIQEIENLIAADVKEPV